jgi:lipid A 4'-phosphatase
MLMFPQTQDNNATINIQDMTATKSRHILLFWDFALPLFLLIVTTILIRWQDWDIAMQRFFFTQTGLWSGKAIPICGFIYKYGTIPALAISIAGLGLFVSSFLIKRIGSWCRIGLYLVLVMLLGPGLIVNLILKDHWGRPRPRNVIEFNGKYAFEEVLTIDPSSPGKSFPSGHASMGFYLWTLYFLTRQRRKLLSLLFFVISLEYGLFVGMIRMMQGGHFLSDILWSGGIVYLCCAACYYLIFTRSARNKDKQNELTMEVT